MGNAMSIEDTKEVERLFRETQTKSAPNWHDTGGQIGKPGYGSRSRDPVVSDPDVRIVGTLDQPSLLYKDCANEAYCEYRYYDVQGAYRVYRIDNPVRMYYYVGCTTHRVLDADGGVHIVPAISQGGCVRYYVPRDPSVPVLG